MLHKSLLTKMFTITTLTLCCLTACQKSSSDNKKVSHANQSTQLPRNSTTSASSSEKVNNQLSTSHSTETFKTASEKEATTSSSPQKSSNPLTSTSKSSENLKASSTTASSTSSTKTETSASTEKNETPFTLTPVSPGAAAGLWGNLSINDDGTVANSYLAVVSNQDQGNGILFLGISDARSGIGFYAHYYPAGVAIPFEHFDDPTDTSRDRLITGNGIDYTHLEEEYIDQLLLPNVTYRQ